MRRTGRASRIGPVLAAGLAAAGCVAGPSQGHGTGPNLVLVIADDMGWNDSGPYGNPAVHTPQLDRLASEGMRFERAYLTASSCSPSRASILTGRYPHATDAEQLHWPLPADHVTLAEELGAAGYWTAAAGKWHLGEAVKDRFDEVREASMSGFVLPTTSSGAEPPRMVAEADPSGCGQWIPLLQARPRDRPFFLWLAAIDPHRAYEEETFDPPHDPAAVVVPPHLPDTPEVRRDIALYYDEIARLDGHLGRVLDELEAQGVADQTLVMFISDNGRPFPRDKTTLYDGGIRTPMIVRWPERVPPGSVTPTLVSSVDIAPTFLDLAGVEAGNTFQGVSFAPVLMNPAASTRVYAFAEDHWHDYEDHGRAVTDGRFKLIRNDYPDLPGTPPADAGRSPTFRAMRQLRDAGGLGPAQSWVFTAPRPSWELYDLESDPHELENRVVDPAMSSTRRRLQEALDAWSQRFDDSVPSTRTPDEFDRETGQPTPARIRPRPSKAEMFPDGS